MGNWGNFYKTWQPWEIARLQRFLSREDMMGDKTYRGDWDGKMNQELFETIKNYQRAYGLPADGLWGYNTNVGHGVLEMDTLQKGSYTKSHNPEIGTYWSPVLNSPYTTVDDAPEKDLADVVLHYSENPEAFYSDTPTDSRWRHIFLNSGDWGDMYANMWAANIPKEKRDKIGGKKLNTSYKQELTKDAIYEGHKKTMPLVLAALGSPAVFTKAGLLGFAGAGIGESVGDNWGYLVGRDLARNPENNHYGSKDPVVQRYGAYIEYDPNRTIEESRQTGRMIGGAIGAGITGYLSKYLGPVNLEGMKKHWYESPRLWNKKSTLETYRPRAVRSDYGIKRGHRPIPTPIPTPPTTVVTKDPSINFENLSRVKARGGIIVP